MNDLRYWLERDVLRAAPLLIGWDLVVPGARARILEVEAYRTPDDPGCHAHNGRTERNRVMFERPGLAYVYLNYGVHYLLNVVAHSVGDPAAILIRAALPLEGIETMQGRRPKAKNPWELLSGPGKLSQALAIGPNLYGTDLFAPSSELRIEGGVPPASVAATTRIGLAAGKGENLPWRFIDPNFPRYLSDRGTLEQTIVTLG